MVQWDHGCIYTLQLLHCPGFTAPDEDERARTAVAKVGNWAGLHSGALCWSVEDVMKKKMTVE